MTTTVDRGGYIADVWITVDLNDATRPRRREATLHAEDERALAHQLATLACEYDEPAARQAIADRDLP